MSDGSQPTSIVTGPISALDRISFPADTTSSIIFNFVVPDEYVSGNRISLSMRGYCDTVPATIR